MKKIFISVMALAISAMAMATEEAYVRIRLTGASGASSVVRLTQDNERSAAYESGYDSEKLMSQANSKSVLLYGIVGSQNCEDVVTNQLEGVELGLVTNQVDADYTLKFENVSGNALQLFDKVQNQYIDIVDNGTYAFSVEAAQVGRVAINDRFVIASAPLPTVQGICFNYNILTLTKYNGATVEVYPYGNTAAAVTANVPSDMPFDVDLNAQASGKYKVAVTVPGATAPEEYIIDVKPAVTTVP